MTPSHPSFTPSSCNHTQRGCPHDWEVYRPHGEISDSRTVGLGTSIRIFYSCPPPSHPSFTPSSSWTLQPPTAGMPQLMRGLPSPWRNIWFKGSCTGNINHNFYSCPPPPPAHQSFTPSSLWTLRPPTAGMPSWLSGLPFPWRKLSFSDSWTGNINQDFLFMTPLPSPW